MRYAFNNVQLMHQISKSTYMSQLRLTLIGVCYDGYFILQVVPAPVLQMHLIYAQMKFMY